MNLLNYSIRNASLLLLVFCHLWNTIQAFHYTPTAIRVNSRGRVGQGLSIQTYHEPQHHPFTTTTTSNTATSLNMLEGGMELMELSYQYQESSSRLLLCVATETNLQVEIFSDLAHVSLDLATFLSPDTVVLRFFIVMGRSCSILADYLPDHAMTVDETLFQSFMFLLSLKMFFTSTIPLLSTTFTNSHDPPSFKDRKVYKQIFSPAGFTWLQFQSLLSYVGLVQWVDIPPHTTFDEEENVMLLVYRGNVECFRNGQVAERYHRCSSLESGSLIGDLSYAKRLTCLEHKYHHHHRGSGDRDTMRSSHHPSSASSIQSKQQYQQQQQQQPQQDPSDIISFKSGSDGVVLLRIDTTILSSLTMQDEKLNECVRNLVFGSIQDKLFRFVHEDHL